VSNCNSCREGTPKCLLGQIQDIKFAPKNIQVQGRPAIDVINKFKSNSFKDQYKIFIIGTNPDRESDKKDIPFLGSAGDFLTEFITKSGMPIDDVWCTYLVKCASPKGRNPSAGEMNACMSYVQEEIKRYKPEIIMLLGNLPLKLFNIREGGISKCRGKVFKKKLPDWEDGPEFSVIPSYNPATFVYRDNKKLRDLVIEDYCIAASLATGKEHKASFYQCNFTVAKTVEDVFTACEVMETEGIFGVDTESPSLNFMHAPMMLLQLSAGINKTHLIPFYSHDPNSLGEWKLNAYWSNDDRNKVRDRLNKLFSNSSLKTVMHNCLLGDMRVFLANGQKISISKLVKDKYTGDVLTVNEYTGKIESKKVIGHIKASHRKYEDWLRIRVKGTGSLRLTKDHNVITSSGRKIAESISVGDKILTSIPTFSPQQESIVLGTLLGDGSLVLSCPSYNSKAKILKNSKSRSPYLKFSHCEEQEEYCKFKASFFDMKIKKMKNNRGFSQGLNNYLFSASSKNDPRLNEFYELGLKKRQVTKEWLDRLTPQAFAIWYCDDGTLKGKGVSFCVSGFGIEGQQLIEDWVKLKGWPVRSWIREDGQLYIDINDCNNSKLKDNIVMQSFWEWFSEYVPNCMKYKVHKLYRDKISSKWWNIPHISKSWADTVTEIGPLFPKEKQSRYSGYSTRRYKIGPPQYCLTVEGNPNFISENLCVSNCKYDLNIIKRWLSIDVKNEVHDTQVMHHLIYEYPPHDLKNLADMEFHVGDWEAPVRELVGGEEGDSNLSWDNCPDDILWPYGANDAELTRRLFDSYWEVISSKPHLLKLYYEESIPILSTLQKAEWIGNKIDLKKVDEMEKIYLERLDLSLIECRKLAGKPDFNPSSPDQVATVLRSRATPENGILNLITDLTKSKGFSTGQDILIELDDPFAEKVLEYRKYRKLISTYINRVREDIDETNRVRYQFRVAGTASGRLSCRFLQQIPRIDKESIKKEEVVLRQMFIEDDGYDLVYFDVDQAELWVFAYKSQCKEMIRILESGDDIHRHTAAAALQITPEETSDFNRSNLGKPFNFGVIYGSQGYEIAKCEFQNPKTGKLEKVGRERAMLFASNFMRKYPEIELYKADLVDIALANNCVYRTEFGREIHVPELTSSDDRRINTLTRELLNKSVQGPAGSITLRTLNMVDAVLAKYKIDTTQIRLINTVHDSGLYGVKKHLTEWFKSVIKSVAERPIPEIYNKKFTVKIGVGSNWAEAELNAK